MYRLWAENEKKEKIELTNSPDYDVTEIDGLLPEKAVINMTKLVNLDGGKFNSARVESKKITITIKPRGNVEENRQRLYDFFRVKRETVLHYKNDTRDLKIAGIVEEYDGSLFAQTQTIDITLLCPKPYFEDRKKTEEVMATIEDLFEFPFAIEKEGIEFSAINKELVKVIRNDGDRETGLIIEMTATGEVVNPIIYNVETRERFGLKIEMQLGDVIRINTNDLNKKVELIRYGETKNIINSIMKGNKWFKLETGDSTFTYQCERGEEYLNIKFTYSNMYEGV